MNRRGFLGALGGLLAAPLVPAPVPPNPANALLTSDFEWLEVGGAEIFYDGHPLRYDRDAPASRIYFVNPERG
jgi:hypothetical protein